MSKREHLLIQFRQLIKPYHWLDITEMLLLVGSVAGTVAAAIAQQAAYAAAPVTLALWLNFLNQKRREGLTQETIPSVISEIELKLSELNRELKALPQPVTPNLNEVNEELSKLNKSVTMIEGKAAFMTSKVYDNLTLKLEALQKQISEFTEPFDLTRFEAKIASLNVAVQFLAQRPIVDLQEFEKLHRQILQVEADRREVLSPYLQQLEGEIQKLQQTDLILTRKVDTLTQKFNARPEMAQLSKLSRIVARLSDSLNQMQQTEAIASLYEDISGLSREINQLKQHLETPTRTHPGSGTTPNSAE
ncbi:hypothetical protein Oscil6304_5989 [Oscillatoria acuminata PCC 6304]|uniref:Uncharacterized protein n=2 Tax=Oscillatoria acuminata TaxID=118323 RepID=K9TTE4_9CYAN|nr:hypothetical protein Oscil6304_5989 [Oscillatoria acuminata PCC 6304]